MDRWIGKIALVTGASAGIGEAIAKALVGAGVQVVGLARRVERVQELADSLKDAKGKLYPVKCDLRDERSIIDTFEWINKELGGVDVLVNNAGVGALSTISDGPTEDFRMILDVNVMAVAICTREAIKSMRSRGKEGHLIFISSIFGYNATAAPYPLSLYPASKYALRALAENVTEEIAIAGDNIKTTSIIPGLVKTNIYGTIELRNTVYSRYPYLEPEDVVDGVVYALSARPNVRVDEVKITPMNRKL